MDFAVLRALIEASPTEHSARNALRTLCDLARDGDLDAALELMNMLGRALTRGDGAVATPPAVTHATLLEIEGPAILRAYGVLLQPRTILTLGPRLAELAEKPIPAELFDGFKRLVASRSVMQDEALKVFVLCAIMRQWSFWTRLDMPTAARPVVLEKALSDTRVIEGENADATFRFGRELLLRLSHADQFIAIVHHELGHHVFDAALNREATTSSTDDSWAEIRDAIPKLMASARRLGPKPLFPGDPRGFRSAAQTSVLCTLVPVETAEYFHLSLTDAAGPIDVNRAATIAWLLLNALAVDPDTAAAAYSSRGVFHFGFRAPGEADVGRVRDVQEPATPERADGERWLEGLRAARRFGANERDIAAMLGLRPRQPVIYGVAADRTLGDMQLAARAASMPRLPDMNDEQTGQVLATAWRIAEPLLLRRVVEQSRNGAAVLRSLPLPVADVAASVCAVRDDSGVACFGPPVEAIFRTLNVLREFNVDLDSPGGESDRTLLTFAAARPAAPLRHLLRCGLDVNRLDGHGEAPLHVCAATGAVEAATLLLDAHALPEVRDREGNTPLHRACANDQAELVELFLRRGADPAAANPSGETPLMLARSAAVADALCHSGAPVEAATHDGSTALTRAAGRGNAGVLTALLSRGADPSHPNRLGEVALHGAVFAPRDVQDCIGILVEAGGDVDEETNEGVTALMMAAGAARTEAVEALLARGARVNASARNGATALLFASDGRNQWTRDFSFGDRSEACLRLLVGAGGDVNRANDEGITPLHASTWGFDAGRVKVLLELGADPNLPDRDGKTALAMARGQEHSAMIDALIAAGAKERP